ncbi:MAG: plastocyanin/azurin family copper-binding protein [Candidatus Bipolaricaulia bacterium]
MQTTRLSKGLALAAVIGLLALPLGAGVQPAQAHGDEGVDLEIHMGSMFFQLHKQNGEEVDAAKNAPIRVKAGEELVIRFENMSKAMHEVHFGKEAVKGEDGHFVRYEKRLFGDDFLGLHVEGGGSAKLHIKIPEDKTGKWELGCFIPGHYAAGMKTPLIIE